MHAEHDPELNADQRHAAAGLRQQLDASAASVDAVSAARLSAARRRALDLTRRPDRTPLWAGATLAAAALVALTLLSWPASERVVPGVDAEALEWLALTEGNAELAEELEFYEWLEQDADAS